VRNRTRAAVALSIVGGVLSGSGLLVAVGVTLSAYLRYLGLVLQLAGFGTVAWGLIDLRRRLSDKPSLLRASGGDSAELVMRSRPARVACSAGRLPQSW
jgi:hypothetical protein